METLETERLILRAWEPDDAEDLYEYASDPRVGPNAGWKPHESLEESTQIVRSFIEGGEVWALVLKQTGKVIGSVGLHHDVKRDRPDIRMVGYVLSPEWWGKGLMTEAVRRVIRFAFEEWKLSLVTCYHYTFNLRSKRVIEKCGFAYEGTLRRASRIYDGSVYDDCCYSITRAEFEGRKAD